MKNYFKKIKNFTSEYQKHISFFTIAVLLVVVAAQLGAPIPGLSLGGKKSAGEIEAIKATSDLKAQSELYKKLILRVGPEKAQDDLYHSGLPFTGQTHLLNHVSGDFIYEKYGNKGLPHCKDYFLSSCYHGFILHAIAEGGMPEVGRSFSECQKLGHTVAMQCGHAIGHGLLANAGYKNLIQGLEACDEAVASMPGLNPFNCYDGLFMENIWAVHDDGKPSPDRWVKEEDHFYPCNDARIARKYLLGCWSNQPALAYQQFKGDVKKVAAEVCAKVKENDLQNMCFNGLARQIHPLTKGNSDAALYYCRMMPSSKWENYCIATNASSSYSVGARSEPFALCAQVEGDTKKECYGNLFSTVKAYMRPGESMKDLCAPVKEEDWRTQCENR